MQRILTLACVAAALPAAASAQVFYGTDDASDSENFLFDTSSGVSTGPAWTGAASWGIADDDANQVVYINDGSTLLSSPAGTLGGAVANVGTLMYMGAARNVTALAFSGGALWGSPNIATEGLYSFDVVTLNGTLVYPYPNTSIDIGGLDFDPATGLLYGSNDASGYMDPQGVGGSGVVIFDVSGAAVSETWTYPYPAGETDLDGLAFDPSGSDSVYLIEDEPAPMHRFDVATMAYDPAPAMNAVLASEVFCGGTYTGAGSGGIGTNYCTALANSTGAAASMSASGSTDVTDNDVTLTASDLPQNAFGFFLTSQTQGLSMMPGGSMGNLCLGGQIGRFVGAGQIQNSGNAGSISLAIDLSQQPTPNGLVQVQAGETWNFTAWFRDSIGGSATSNFADGLQVDFN